MHAPSTLSTLLLLCGAAVSSLSANPTRSQAVDASILALTGKPIGTEIKQDTITTYISRSDKHNTRAKAREGVAVLFLTDVYGLPLTESRLFVISHFANGMLDTDIPLLSLADSFARAGYVTVMPDLFGGVPAPGDINVPGFNTTEFLDRHSPDVTDPIVASTIEYIHTKLGVSRIFATGYCFGGRYAFRFADARHGVQVVFAAHPSLLQSSEILAVEGPVAVAAGDHDSLFTAELRSELEALLLRVAQPYQVSLYSGTEHGFAVRVDLDDPQQKLAKQESFLQAVRWFDHFL